MKRLLLSFALIAVTSVIAAKQGKDQIPATTKSDEARQHYEKGLSLGENVRIAEAIEEFTRALNIDPGFVSAQAVLAFYTPGEAGLQQRDGRRLEQASPKNLRPSPRASQRDHTIGRYWNCAAGPGSEESPHWLVTVTSTVVATSIGGGNTSSFVDVWLMTAAGVPPK